MIANMPRGTKSARRFSYVILSATIAAIGDKCPFLRDQKCKMKMRSLWLAATNPADKSCRYHKIYAVSHPYIPQLFLLSLHD